MRHLRPVGLAAAVALSLTVAACSSSSSSSSSPATSPPAATSAAASPVSGTAGAVNMSGSGKATGTPLVFGYVNDDTGTAGAFPEETAGTEATISYINNHMDGVNGRPIKLVPCSDDGTPARAASCATQVLQSNPIGIIGGADFATSSSVPLFTAAGKPYIGGVAFSGPENTSSLSFQWNNTTAIGGALIPYAIQTLHVKSIVGLYPTGNGSALEADELSKEIAENMGLPASAFKIESFSATAPDLTPAIRAAEASDPGAIVGSTGGPQCITLAQAMQELDVKAALLLPSGCFSKQNEAQAGSAFNGVYAGGSAAQPDSPQWKGDPDMKLFVAILQEYSPSTASTPLVSFALDGYQTVMNLRNVLLTLPPSGITTASLVKALRNTVNEPDVLGTPYTCKTPPIKQVPGLCTVSGYVYEIQNGSDNLVSGVVDGAKYITSVPGLS
jgi:branched-chain amino acid transport system substrate-binding protein